MKHDPGNPVFKSSLGCASPEHGATRFLPQWTSVIDAVRTLHNSNSITIATFSNGHAKEVISIPTYFQMYRVVNQDTVKINICWTGWYEQWSSASLATYTIECQRTWLQDPLLLLCVRQNISVWKEGEKNRNHLPLSSQKPKHTWNVHLWSN